VHSLMLIKLASICKRFATQCAFIWFFASMNSHMSNKFTFKAK
jgi:hypothetical protein